MCRIGNLIADPERELIRTKRLCKIGSLIADPERKLIRADGKKAAIKTAYNSKEKTETNCQNKKKPN